MKIKRTIIFVSAVVAFVLISFFLFKARSCSLMSKKTEASHMQLMSQIRNVAELTTSKVEYCDVIAVKAEVMGGFSKAYNIVKFYGVIRVGLENVSDINVSIDKDNNKAVLRVPHCKVLGNDLTELESFDEKRGLFVAVDTQMVFEKLIDAKKVTEENLINKGIITDAEKNMENLLINFVKAMGYSEVEVNWID